MPTIEMVRVDNRLIHGQISTRWCTQLEINTIIVVNDEVATNKVLQGLFDMSIPDSFDSRYFSIEKAIQKLPLMSSEKRVLLVVESIHDLRQIVEADLGIRYINLGNLDMAPGRRHVTPSICLEQAEIDWLKDLAQTGVKVEARRIPSDESALEF